MTPAEVAAAAQLACLLEASAPKPGNVAPGRHFRDLRYEDFLAAAAAIGAPLAGAASRGLGDTVRLAIEATTRWTRSNANLGIVLLLAPLVRARQNGELSRDAVSGVLEQTTVEDAHQVYAAIRLASPGGLGRVDDQDVADTPTAPLLDVMRLAADRDGIAREYASSFETTLTVGAPALERARRDGLDWSAAVVETFLTLLAHDVDTHIARRGGGALAAHVSTRARGVLGAGGVRSAAGQRAIDGLDRELRDAHNTANPGTTADLTAAAIFVALVGGSRQ